ncbi:hypothetical protein TWF730_007376 [Orbilia blumenaviensis]|uniref:Uncharacterized protein n=1 Tax=Orbilia blumenaviensis TaxID=1796055 RepID=A0AAV9V9E1_9PEZI
MPRRGLFRRANDFGVFDQGGNPADPQVEMPLPLPAPDGPQLPTGEPAAAPNSDNLAEMLSALMPGAFPQFQEDVAQQAIPVAATAAATAVPPLAQAPLPPPPPQTFPLVRKQGRLRRFANHIHNHNWVAADFQTPQAPQMSWTEVRAKLGAPPPPADPVRTLYDWDRVRHRIGLQPTYEFVAAYQSQQQQAGLQNQPQINLPAPEPAQFQPAPQQPVAAQYMIIQTPQGPMYIPQPPAPGAQNPMTGQPTENPWSQQDAKGLATVLLLAGMKLSWNAATSMWDAVTSAYNQNFEDKVKLRDQTNQWINDCVRRGYVRPVQQPQPQPQQQHPQSVNWPQWGAAQQQQPAPQTMPPRWY